MERWKLGIGASCLGSLLIAIGLQLRILAISVEGRKRWTLELCGWCAWISGQGLGQVAIALAPATIAASLSFSVALLCNFLLAPVVLQERLTKLHCLGVLLLSFGALLVIHFSSHTSWEYSGDHFMDLAQRGPFVGLASCCYSLAVLLAVRTLWGHGRLDAASFAFVFALCGATDLTVTKFALQLLGTWIAVKPPHPSTSVVVSLASAMVCLHLGVLWFQAVSTRYGRALQNVPLFLASGFIMQVSFGGTFYNEFSEFDARRSAVFSLGLAIMLVGLGVTSHAAPDAVPTEQEEALLDNEAIMACEEPRHLLPEALMTLPHRALEGICRKSAILQGECHSGHSAPWNF